MKTTKLTTVTVDQIFEDCPIATKRFNDGEFSSGLGYACNIIVSQKIFQSMLDDVGLVWYENELNMEQTPLDFERKKLYDRFDKLKDSILIDLGS